MVASQRPSGRRWPARSPACGPPSARTASPAPTESSAANAFPNSDSPAPTGPGAAARSKTVTSIPWRCRPMAVTSPPIPAPMTLALHM